METDPLHQVPEEFRAELQRKAELMTKFRSSPYCPLEPLPLQWAFILDERREIFFGGAAGGAKSVAQLMSALLYVDQPRYRCLLLRRTYADLSLPGALMDIAEQWLSGTEARRKEKGREWHFPSGAKVVFGFMQNDSDMFRYTGSNFHSVHYDEAAQFTPKQLQYLFSRLRQSKEDEKAGIPLRMRLSSNPGGPGHEYLKDRYVQPKEYSPDRLYIPSRITDNPHLGAEAYRKMLSELDVVTRAQLEHGDWNVVAEGNFFESNLPVVPAALSNGEWDHPRIQRCRAWDLAATSAENKGDWAAGVLLAYDPKVKLWRIEHVARVQAEPGKLEGILQATSRRDGSLIPQIVEQEGGASGKMVQRDLRVRVFAGSPVYTMQPTGSKMARARLIATLVSAGDVEMAPGPWNEAFLLELLTFPQGANDDMVDAVSYAVHWLAKQLGGLRVRASAYMGTPDVDPLPVREEVFDPGKALGRGMRIVRSTPKESTSGSLRGIDFGRGRR